MRRHFYGRRDDADHAAEVLRDFGLLPFVAVNLLDDLEQWEVCVSELPAQQPDASMDVGSHAGPVVDPHEDDFISSAWDWEREDERRGRRHDFD